MDERWLCMAREPIPGNADGCVQVVPRAKARWFGRQWRVVAVGEHEAMDAARRLMLTEVTSGL